MTGGAIRPVTHTESINPSSDAQIDRDLAERLRSLGESNATQDECYEPLGAVWLEAALWLSGAAVVWIVVASYSA